MLPRVGRNRPPPELVAKARAHPAYPPTFLDKGEGLVVCDKPAGLASTGRNLEDPNCLQAHVMASKHRIAWAVHQLDRDTSGVNLFVVRRALVDTWANALKRGTKTYLAVVAGEWPHGQDVITAPIERVDGQPRVVEEGRPTRTTVTPIASTADASLLFVQIETGRTHQVRLHLAHRGHPVWGDHRYGTAADERQLLHAWRVECEGRTWTAPVPLDLRAFLNDRTWSDPEAVDALLKTTPS